MECSQTRKMISQYVDCELEPNEEKGLLSHVADCPECKRELEEVKSMQHLFASAERFEAPLGFVTRVMARLEERDQVSSSFWSFFTLQPAFLRIAEVAFALVIVVVGVLSGNLLVADRASIRQPTVKESFSLDLFQATPPDSVGGVYASLTGVADER